MGGGTGIRTGARKGIFLDFKLALWYAHYSMGWATRYIEKLQSGQKVQFRPRGNSMVPRIRSGQLVTVEPLTEEDEPTVGDVVLCKVGGSQYLHRILAVRNDLEFQIGNNRGGINGWTPRKNVYGLVTKVED